MSRSWEVVRTNGGFVWGVGGSYYGLTTPRGRSMSCGFGDELAPIAIEDRGMPALVRLLVERFAREAQKVGATLHHAADDEAAAGVVAEVARRAGLETVLIAPGLPV